MSYEDYLAHFGILGMRWGKRNGPPYPLSYRQMNPEQRKLRARSYEKAGVDPPKKTETSTVTIEKEKTGNSRKDIEEQKSVSEMTDKELKAVNDRYADEKKYRELQRTDVRQGKTFVKGVLALFGTTAVITFATATAKRVGNAGEKALGPHIDSGAQKFVKKMFKKKDA